MVDYVETTAPSNPSAGETWFNPDTNLVKVWTGSVWASLGDHNMDHEPGGIDELKKITDVKRDITGSVVFTSAGSGTTTTTATGTTVTTKVTTTANLNFTSASLVINGAATTVTGTLKRNGTTLTSTAGAATPVTLTTSATTNLTGTITWTAVVQMAAGTTVSATLSPSRNDTTTINKA